MYEHIVFRKKELSYVVNLLNKAEDFNTTYCVYTKYLRKKTLVKMREYNKMVTQLQNEGIKLYKLIEKDYYNRRKMSMKELKRVV